MSEASLIATLLGSRDEPTVFPENERMSAFCALCEDNDMATIGEEKATGAFLRHALDCPWALARAWILTGC